MAMSDRTKKSNLGYILIHGGTKICRALFEKKVKELKPPDQKPETWSVDIFLEMEKSKLENRLTPKNKMIVFPTGHLSQTNLSRWDVSILCSILTKTCKLSSDQQTCVDEILDYRNEIAHLTDSDMNDQHYEFMLYTLKNSYKTLLSEIGDGRLNQTIQTMFTDLESGLVPFDELSKVEETLCELCEEVIKDHKNARKTVEKDSAIESLLTTLVQLLLANQDNSNAGNPLPDPINAVTTLRMRNCSPELENAASTAIVKEWNQSADHDDSDPSQLSYNQIQMRQAFSSLKKKCNDRGLKIKNIEVGCIDVHIECSSILACVSLLKDYATGSLDVLLNVLEDATRSLVGCCDLQLETVIYEYEFFRILSQIDFEQFVRMNKSVTGKSRTDLNQENSDTAGMFGNVLRNSLTKYLWKGIQTIADKIRLAPTPTPKHSSAELVRKQIQTEGGETERTQEKQLKQIGTVHPRREEERKSSHVVLPKDKEIRKETVDAGQKRERIRLNDQEETVTDLYFKERGENSMLTKPWRDFEGDGGWNNEYHKRLWGEIHNTKSPSNVPKVRILFIGPVKAGKSSFINSAASIDACKLSTPMEAGAAASSLTISLRQYILRDNFVLMDIMGVEEQEGKGVHTKDIIYLMDGNIRPKYTFDPDHPIKTSDPSFNINPGLADKAHCVVFVMDCHVINSDSITDVSRNKIKTLVEHVRPHNVPVLVVLTHIDVVSTEVKTDVSTTYHSRAVELCVNKAHELFGVPIMNSFPVKNYSDEMGLNDNKSIMIMLALRKMMQSAVDRLKGMDHQKYGERGYYQQFRQYCGIV